MSEDTCIYKVVPNIDKYYFKCVESQFIGLAYSYYGEFWKLFIGQKIDINFDDKKNSDEIFSINEYIEDNAEKYYGIKMEPVSTLDFNSNQVYLIFISCEHFPLSVDVDEGDHCFIIYGDTEEGYLVYDNFYQKSTYVLDHNVSQYFDIIYSLKRQNVDHVDYLSDIINYMSDIPKWIKTRNYHSLNTNTIYKYEPTDLYDLLRNIASYIKKESVLISNLVNDDEYIHSCGDILDVAAYKIKMIQCSLLKSKLKFSTIPYNKFVEQMNDVIKYLLCQYKIRKEIVAILKEDSSLKTSLKDQLLQYFQIHEVDLSDFSEDSSIYEIHDRASIMYLMNYYEECNNVNEISPEVYSECDTYKEFMLATYREILCNNLVYE